MSGDLTYQDADGTWPVVEWRIYYRRDLYCSCKGHDVSDPPERGVQAVCYFIRKDGKVRCHIESGVAADPSIYHFFGRELIGTMLSDKAFFTLERRVNNAVRRRLRYLNGT